MSRQVGRAVLLLLACAGRCRGQAEIVLSAAGVQLEADPTHGTLLRLHDLPAGTTLAAPAGAAENYRLVVQPPEGAAATILGREQRLSDADLGANRLTLEWRGPLRDSAGGEHAIDVTMTVVAAERGLTFGLHLENRSQSKVLEVWYPFAGGLSGVGEEAALWAPTSNPTLRPVQPPAGGAAFGYPGHLNLSFCAVQSQAAGQTLYFAVEDPVARQKTFRFVEAGGDLLAAIQHQPSVPPGGNWSGAPVVLRFVPGNWTAAAARYRDFFVRTFGVVQPQDDWIRRQSFFLMTMFMLPEGTINYTFADIPRWARAARDAGLGAVQISGWQRGGHDNGYPSYEPDPRLGTWEELEAGIRYCHQLGLKVFFFVNYQPMMVESDWYKRELQHYREMGPNGAMTWLAGWGMGTLWARAGHPKLMTWANLAFPQFRKIIVDYFAKLASLGADGVHVDKMFPTALDHNPNSPLPPDEATWTGAIELTEEILRECRARNPDWCMSFECNWDRMLQFGGATWWVGNQLVTRRVFPEHVETLAITQAYDYLGINNAVRDGHAVMLAPLSFARGLDWPPMAGLAAYVRDVKRIRDALRETVFWGESVSAAALDVGLPDGVAMGVWRHRGTGRRVAILTNARNEPRRLTFPTLGASRRARLHAPGARARDLTLPAEVTIAPERLAFVEELGDG